MNKRRRRSLDYHYKPGTSLRETEAIAYRKTALIIIVTIGCLVALYFIGIPLVANLHTFWGNVNQTSITSTTGDEINHVAPPTITNPPSITNQSSITLSGYSTADYSLALRRGETLLSEAEADLSGKFTFTDILLAEGLNTFTVLASDGSSESEPLLLSIRYDKTPPILTIEKPSDGETISTKEPQVTVEGITESTGTIMINDHQVIIESSGKFAYRLVLIEGENKISAIAKDEAGNEKKVELTVLYQKPAE